MSLLSWVTKSFSKQVEHRDSDYYLHRSSVFYHACSTPLSSILLNLDMASEHRHVNDSRTYLNQAKQSAQYLSKLFHHLVDQEQQTHFRVKDAVAETVRIFRSRVNPSVLLNVEGVFEHVQLYGKKLYFQEMLLCLFQNAFESYSDQAKIKLITITFRKESNYYELTIIDGGQGLKHKESLLLSDGFSTKPQHQGLGLSFAKNVMKLFGGKIKILSTYRGGTTVCLNFPR